MEISAETRRQAFAWWLRTGWLPSPRGPDGVELKFNPNHDPQNGRFTFGSGGFAARAAQPAGRIKPQASLSAAGPEREPGRGDNIRAFQIPMTLEQTFPGLQNAPGGAIIAVADSAFDFTGPANEMTMQVLQDQSTALSTRIKALDPDWHYDEIGPTDASGTPITTLQGLTAKVDDLRFQHAAIVARLTGNYGPLQVETLRFVQQRVDSAYEEAQAQLKAGRLNVRLSSNEAIGNYVDREVRRDLRDRYARLNIDAAGKGSVRVNRREDDSSGNDLTYRRPDLR
jgi:hypothetical protein